MNKTVSINLGGFFFHIDEDAYQKLTRYFDAIKRSLTPDGKEEIMNDIEGRIAELLSEKLKNDKQVVSIREIDDIIAIMGQPEDYKIDEETTVSSSYSSSSQTYFAPGYTKTKKFYRDGDRGMIGGVCAGVAHYFRIDPLWVRIIFIITLFISFGTSIFVYLLLWILIPKAITTTEKLEMTGEPINITNIEKKVREEIDNISSKFQNVDYNKLGNDAKTGAERIGSGIGSVFLAIFKAISKVIGALITIFAAITLGSLIIFFFTVLFTSGIPGGPWHELMNIANYTETPLWILGLLFLITIGVPFFFLFLLGLKILIENPRPIGNTTKYTLLAIWLIAVAFSIYLGIRQATEVAYEGKTMQKEEILLTPRDTLNIKFRYDEYFAKSVDQNTDFRFVQDTTGTNLLYSNSVELYFMKTDAPTPYLQVEKVAEGGSISEARERAEKINYSFDLQGNNLTLDNCITTEVSNKFRNQKVKVYVYIPEGTIVNADKSIRHYHRSDYSLYIPYNDQDHLYKLVEDELECLDCPVEGENGDSVDTDVVAHGHIMISEGNTDINIKVTEKPKDTINK
ncbi:PspC domain-containing protein [Flavobacterium alkalisoli]|uniref:PspC domain-containing protein n=1 Tax=Flavobacterium alkalisoli TaxID=2602769 RepID=UPI003A9095FF